MQLSYLGTESSPILTNTYQDGNVGIDGSSFNFAQHGKNVINVHFKLHVRDRYDYEAKRQQIYSMFVQKRVFRLRFEEDGNLVVFVRPVGFDINPFERAGHDCDIIIPFENPSGFKYSRYDSLNQADLWDDYQLDWHTPILVPEDFHFHDQHNFRVYNPSGIPIDPYIGHNDLKIIARYTGGIFGIGNNTNGSSYELKCPSDGTDKILIDGMNTYINGTLNNDKSNFGNLKLEPGWNDIWTGTTTDDVKFKFPFIFV